MTGVGVGAGALAALACMVLCAGAGPAHAETALEAEGRAFVEAHCAACHATGGEDASPHEAAPPFRELNRRYPVEFLGEALAEGIVTGHPDMPVFELEPGEIDAVIAWLKAIAE